MSNAERSAMPVMMPGSAIGRMKRSEMTSWPKKRARDSGALPRGAENQRQERRESRDLQRQPERVPDVGAADQATRTSER